MLFWKDTPSTKLEFLTWQTRTHKRCSHIADNSSAKADVLVAVPFKRDMHIDLRRQVRG